MVRELVQALLEVLGLVLVVTGVGLAWLPAGVVAAGVAVLVVARQTAAGDGS